MKRAALRYAEILEKGAWVTHQEQAEIAKLLRSLAMTEDEAWDELEARLNKAKETPTNTIKELAKQAGIGFNDGSDLHTTIKRFAELITAAEREACAEHYLAIMRDAVEQAALREREACAKVCEAEYKIRLAETIRARGEK